MAENETAMLRVSRGLRDRINAAKGGKTVEDYLGGLVSGKVLTVPEKVGTDDPVLGEMLEKIRWLYADKRKYPGVKGNGVGRQKSKDSILLEFEAWSNTYLARFGLIAREHVERNMQAVKTEWLEKLSLETETVTGPGGE
jgi:hypothetical protein